MAVFITGAAGFLGTETAELLVRSTGEKLWVLVRASDREAAEKRLRRAWAGREDLLREIGKRILPAAGDFTKPDLGLDEETRAEIADLREIYHIGAETGIQKSREELFRINLEGTENVLAFAKSFYETGSLRRFVFVSTAYTAGRRKGLILEEDPRPDTFSSYYEESKARAEEKVMASGLPYTIARPGMIVGSSVTGEIRRFNTVYYVLKLLLQEKLGVIPCAPDARINIVPVDYVASCLTALAEDPRARNRCFHLTLPEEKKPTAGDLLDYTLRWAGKNLALNVRRPLFVPVSSLEGLGLFHNRREDEKTRNILSNLLALMPYFFDSRVFDRRGTDALVGRQVPDWHVFMGQELAYACRNNFLHQSERNVFEQVLFRQESTSAPISYYDVGENGMRKITGPHMEYRIRQIAAALDRLGVKKGGKVAMAGINSTDYFALDIAIGLIGAVSVPVYYTTPVREIDYLLEKSGAGWLFVGDRRILSQIGDLKSRIPLILFSAALEDKKPDRPCMTWWDFLAGAAGELWGRESLSELTDLATIRYTSGTTGDPKGVMFNTGQLAFMGQVMTALLPWRDRQKEMRYLSFLPLSHVVEGILASYAPYYVHCPVKYYYLNDFGSLTKALPKIRPTVFFSVPRFYEKLWQQIEESSAGKRYLQMTAGPARKALGRVIRRTALKKAGLDRCAQLIVGSAPVSEALLLSFRELGIEIYNAYGQTEAPLITINRIGDNVIPSIGTALPDTGIELADDGELIVKGPQVCLGYYGLETDTIRDGVLKTGDLGRKDAAGHIYLEGRKKEMIITSYGKNINCPKIEERLRSISGISQALLIGENRPFCTALLWAEKEIPDLKEKIGQMNLGLSHPEQIRRWKLIDIPLSIAREELTPNLKVRRRVVEEHYQDEISSMYADH